MLKYKKICTIWLNIFTMYDYTIRKLDSDRSDLVAL